MYWFALPAAVLGVYAIANLIFLICQIVAALGIDYGMPVSVIQGRLEALRMLRIRYLQVSVLAGMLVWTAFVIVILKLLFDVDAYRSPGIPWLTANLAFSVAVVALAVFLAKKFGPGMTGSLIVQRFLRDLAGYNLNEAAGFLATLAEFHEEDGKGERADVWPANDRDDIFRSASD
jgi:hypothetical protein